MLAMPADTPPDVFLLLTVAATALLPVGVAAAAGAHFGVGAAAWPAALLALAAVGRFGVRGVTVSDAGLLEGILATIGKNGGEEE
ncbi:hypothetical protein [Staphylococcus aureus]|uniref:hypothetical protein n=1 Tax=Staphylococcus aureus TaxID=1280 RepID=UPI00237AF370|nr:hypothetical protein [Staphylococcus aureus]MDD9423398.1 hypothetical protein [Staphylococcus aureus]